MKNNREGANMGYDAYVHIKKKYTKLAIEKLLMLMDYEKRGRMDIQS